MFGFLLEKSTYFGYENSDRSRCRENVTVSDQLRYRKITSRLCLNIRHFIQKKNKTCLTKYDKICHYYTKSEIKSVSFVVEVKRLSKSNYSYLYTIYLAFLSFSYNKMSRAIQKTLNYF